MLVAWIALVGVVLLGVWWYVGKQPQIVTVVERAETDVVVDLGETGDSIEDLLAFGNPIYDADNASQIGTDQGECFRTTPGVSWECTWTVYLDDGSITVQGPFLDSLEDSTLAITGGTGSYAGARGEMTLHARSEAGTEFDFTYHWSR
jgi:hypothetical protein